MGNQSIDNSQTLKVIQQLQDPHFGQIDIYRTQDGRFIMKSQRSHIIGDVRHRLFKNIMTWIQRQRQEYVVPIMHIENKIESGLCIQIQSSEIYTEYYNFTLLDLVKTKKELQQPQIWFIMHSLLVLATNLRTNKFAVNFDISSVFITLKGIPCVYYNTFLSFQESISYSEYGMGQQISIILLQLCISQQIGVIEQGESKDFLPLVSKLCSKYKLLGRMVKQLLNRQKNQQEILLEIDQLINQSKINKFNQIKLNKFRYVLPQTSALKLSNKKYLQKQNKNNNPIQFRPRKSIDKGNSKNKLTQKRQNKNQQINNHLAKKMISSKEDTQRVFMALQKRKQQNKIKMQKVALKKQQLNLQQQTKKQKISTHKRSQQKANNQKRSIQQSKCSIYR